MRYTTHIFTTMAAALAAIVASAQWQFEVDTTFRTEILRIAASSLLPMDDGKVIASGVMRFPGEFSDKRLIRLMEDGIRDPTFNNSGLGGGSIKAWQDRFYVNAGLVRRILLPDGTNDTSFRLGYLPIPFYSFLQGGDYHVYPDGSVLMSGAHMLSDTIRGFTGLHNLIWFTNTGYLDTTKTHRTGDGVVYRFQELPDGKFICSGLLSTFNGIPVDRLFRVHADGSTDTTFSTGVYWGEVKDYWPLEDGSVIVAGIYRTSQVQEDTVRLARFLPNGDLDPAFAIPQFALGGYYNTGGLGSVVRSITPWEGGRMIVAGYFGEVNGQPRGSICMLDSNGVLLDAFDGCGVGQFVHQNYHYQTIGGFVPAGDGEHFYIHGAYVGYNDGQVNDTLQRFVSRLRMVEDFTVTVQESALPPATLTVHPNPSNGMVHINMGHMVGQVTAEVHDALGRRVTQRALNGNQDTLDLQALPDGVYFIKLRAHDRLVSTQRVVLQR